MSNDDSTIDDIKALIMEAESPRDKAELLILLKISQSLAMNTDLTQKLSNNLDLHVEQFSRHEKDEMTLINQGRGFFRAMLAALTLFQAVGAWYLTEHSKNMDRIAEEVKQLSLFRAEHQAHHKEERETYKAWLNGPPKP